MSTPVLVGIAVVALAVLLVLIIRLRLPAYVSLLLVAVATALATGMPVDEIMPAVVDGMGSTLGNVALLVGLGAMLGAIIEKTGGAAALATMITRRLGPERVGPALLLTSAIFAVPIFFDVGFIILLPIIFSFAKAAGHRSPVFVGVPVAALMVFIHNMVPPHPGVTGSATLLGADIGTVTIVGLLITVPLGFLAHYVARIITGRREFPIDPLVQKRFDTTVGEGGAGADAPAESTASSASDPSGAGSTATVLRERTQPGALAVASMVVLPILMISVGTIGEIVLEEGTQAARIVALIGQPGFALLLTVALAIYVLGVRNGWRMEDLGGLMDASLAPAAIVVFVTGAGGVFARILTDTGIGETISALMLDTGVPILLLAFLLATVFKVAQGSGTVATLAAAGLVQSTVTSGDYTSLQVALIVLAIGCGSTALSHVNDSGFWVANKFMGLSVADGLRTWTVLTTILGWAGMLIISALWMVIS